MGASEENQIVRLICIPQNKGIHMLQPGPQPRSRGGEGKSNLHNRLARSKNRERQDPESTTR